MDSEDIKLLGVINSKLDYYIDRLNVLIVIRDNNYIEKHNLKGIRDNLRDTLKNSRHEIINWNSK